MNKKRFTLAVPLLVLTLTACSNLLPHQEITAPPPRTETATPAAEQTTVANTSELFPAIDVTPPEYTNVWDRIRADYGLAELHHPYVARHERWFANNPEYLERITKRARLYLYYIVEEIEKRNMPMEIALLPAIESAFKPHAYSRARAAGLWQFIPSTGRLYGLRNNWWYDGRRDVMAATNAALNYLQKLEKDFDGDWHLALAAYNAGEGRVMGAQAYNRRKGRSDRFEHLRTLKRETRNYVPKLIALSNIIKDPQAYGLTLEPIPNEPYFTSVPLDTQIDISVLARKADIPVGDIYDINPGFRRWATSPDHGPDYLLIPAGKQQAVLNALADLPADQRVKWKRHRIRRGDALSTIAYHYGVSVYAIQQANRMRGTRIRAGRDLIIPVSSRRITAHAGNVTRPVPRKAAPPPKGRIRVVHKVKAGDTLWNIALKYNVYISQITRWNRVSRRSVLRLGQKLKIWVKPKAPTAAISTTKSI